MSNPGPTVVADRSAQTANVQRRFGPPLADVLLEQIDGGEFVPAGLTRRAAALAIDAGCLLFGLVLFSAGGLAVHLGSGLPTWTLVLGLTAATVFGWTALCECSWTQATPGKRILELVVTDRQGHRIGPVRSVVRFSARATLIGLSWEIAQVVRLSVPGAPVWSSSVAVLMLVAAGHVIQLFSPQRQTLHDRVAGTLVRHRPRPEANG